ncbi:MAG: L-glutamate gamma-semialdehyde dehydrogenase [Alphaproteobacteria bacterium]|nr:L-glutamate gamma-semialdehyde dehydrogenase [Alphaproteobacteria bacterium]
MTDFTPLSGWIYKDEPSCVNACLADLAWHTKLANDAKQLAEKLVNNVRGAKHKIGEIEIFLQQYGLNTAEGLALMSLAEALLRIPDHDTANALVRDKILSAEWKASESETSDWLLKVSSLGLSLSRTTLDSLIGKLSAPVIREALKQAVKLLGEQFVMGHDIQGALKRAENYAEKGYNFSFDMLGEGARTMEQAAHYYNAYEMALNALPQKSGLSIKLSAIHPRYEIAQQERCVPDLIEKLVKLLKTASAKDIRLTIDAEETDRLVLSLIILEKILQEIQGQNLQGLGLALQAYQKRALPVIDLIVGLAEKYNHKLHVRLVKGAYWDSEVKRAQIRGVADYPLFTRKVHTDVSYLACARKLLQAGDKIDRLFATHNAFTIAAIAEMAKEENVAHVEFQRLHGMGESLHDTVLSEGIAKSCIYAPVGAHEDLLPYLVRRLLENGANSSFVHKISDPRVPVADLTRDPVAETEARPDKRHANLPLPPDIYGASRKNSRGYDLSDIPTYTHFEAVALGFPLPAAPSDTSLDAIDGIFTEARKGFETWHKESAQTRANCLVKLAELLEKNTDTFIGLCAKEAGKTIPDAIAEIREAVDFCRYYAAEGLKNFAAPHILPGPTGERNSIEMRGRGTFVCISPWNFPLAIFLGQITAALMAGNSVIAKPAEQTPRIANLAIELAHKAGIPPRTLQIVFGDGKIGGALTNHKDVAGVAFTGSTEVAQLINRALAAKDGAIVPLIAETGGQNAMIVDSSALPEQVVDDVIISAFGSAGQRCSALRVLCLQDDIADKVLPILKGAMALLRVDNPALITTDIGPVIDREAYTNLENHVGKFTPSATAPLTGDALKGRTYFRPTLIEIDDISQLTREVFGPILHVVRFKRDKLDDLVKKINATGYGLTFGLHSRVDSHIAEWPENIKAGNIYINRSMIGAVVGVQPFGGMGLSGTGPKAGGPHYLPRFATEKVVSNNITATGGNTDLVNLAD